ncbi:MAG: peroxisomal assembly protein [Cirrosporium novae-zelandiae]|nr:MAG: peroxisomal assembly protein [Cirrosporium novae-zelandiae]
MSFGDPEVEHQRRRKRRRQDKQPIVGRLIFDEDIKGDTGVLSDDLSAELFPALKLLVGPDQDNTSKPPPLYVAISAWNPLSSALEDDIWTIIPVQPSLPNRNAPTTGNIPHSTIRFPANSRCLQYLAQSLSGVPTAKGLGGGQRLTEVQIIDVAPLALGAIYVSVDGDLLRKHQETQNQFGGGFVDTSINGSMQKGKAPLNNQVNGSKSKREWRDRLPAAIREALSKPKIIRTGLVISLPWPSHPITYAPAPPVKVVACEPVSQGLLLPQTKIILIQSHQKRSQIKGINGALVGANPERPDDTDDTSNEQFYSAAEDRSSLPPPSSSDGSADELSESATSAKGSGDSSDDSLDDMISLATPSLTSSQSGGLSSLASATPRAVFRRPDGVSTPRSVVSNFTATTARPGGVSAGKILKTQALLQSIPEDALHPKPAEDEDENSRVYVDISTLRKIGCFSGDWVRIEATEQPQANTLTSINLSALATNIELSEDFRVAKVYALPEVLNKRPRYHVDTSANRKESISLLQRPSLNAVAHLSPVFLSNLQETKYIRISPLSDYSSSTPIRPAAERSRQPKLEPPLAKEVTLLKVSSPLSTDRALQPALMASLKQYFEQRRRLVKSGDLVGISIDENLARVLFSFTKPPDADPGADSSLIGLGSRELNLSKNKDVGAKNKKIGVAWFRVSQLTTAASGPDLAQDRIDLWGGTAVLDPLNTKLVQAGSECSRIPKTMESTWEYYFGIKSLPNLAHLGHNAGKLIMEPPKPHATGIRRRLRELISAGTSLRAIHLQMKPTIILLTSTQRAIGKHCLAARACADTGLHFFTIDAYDILTEGGANGGDVKTEALLKARFDRAMSCGSANTVLIIRHVEILTADRMVSALKDIFADSRVVIGTSTEVEKVPDGVRSLFTHELEMSAPDEGDREGILRDVIAARGVKLSSDVDLGGVAVKTAALVAGDLVDVVERAITARKHRLETLANIACKTLANDVFTARDVIVSGGESALSLTKADFTVAVDAARKNFADAIGAPKIPNVTWDDVGGLTNVKDAVMETIQLPLERPELFGKGMKKRSGILFYGPPGTGKTLLAKAIATEFSLNFFSVKGPELLNMYIGESEANVRRVFQRARDARPCVVFFDELDSVAPKRGNQGDSGGVMDRIVSQLLAELDGMSDGDEGGGGVFVIGATNRPDLLDQALLRPGRFDKMLYLGVSDTHDKQLTILEALTRKFTLHPELSLRRVADTLPFTYTGADFYALCSDSMLKAITRQASAVDAKIKAHPEPITTAYFFDHLATPEDIAVMVTEDDFLGARNELVPSVSAKELEHFERVRKTFEASDDKKPALPVRTKSISRSGPPNEIASPTVAGSNLPKKPKLQSRQNSTRFRDKWKGKAPARDADWVADGMDEDGDGEGEGPDDYGPNGPTSVNGSLSAKAKGKLRAGDADGDIHEGAFSNLEFGDPAQGDEGELYGVGGGGE